MKFGSSAFHIIPDIICTCWRAAIWSGSVLLFEIAQTLCSGTGGQFCPAVVHWMKFPSQAFVPTHCLHFITHTNALDCANQCAQRCSATASAGFLRNYILLSRVTVTVTQHSHGPKLTDVYNALKHCWFSNVSVSRKQPHGLALLPVAARGGSHWLRINLCLALPLWPALDVRDLFHTPSKVELWDLTFKLLGPHLFLGHMTIFKTMKPGCSKGSWEIKNWLNQVLIEKSIT